MERRKRFVKQSLKDPIILHRVNRFEMSELNVLNENFANVAQKVDEMVHAIDEMKKDIDTKISELEEVINKIQREGEV